jgi:hypothetical protein
VLVETVKEREHSKDLSVEATIIQQQISKKRDVRVWSGFV